MLNLAYNRLNPSAKRRFYLLFAKIARDRARVIKSGTWRVRSAGVDIVVPLRAETAWLDWDLSLALLGNDQEVKDTYFAMLASAKKPEVFLDIGANYGSHSLLFLAAGVPTLSFEPNPACVEHFTAWAGANQLRPNIEQVALSDADGEAAFEFPEDATWLGSLRMDAETAGERDPALKRIHVQVRRLDDFRDRIPTGRLLIKLDAEGAEPAIIRGAAQVIAERSPYLIFECWNDRDARSRILDALDGRFRIFALPWSPGGSAKHLDVEAFLSSHATNFIAAPIGSR